MRSTEIIKVLELAEVEIKAMYKRNGLTGSNVLTEIENMIGRLCAEPFSLPAPQEAKITPKALCQYCGQTFPLV